MVKASGYWTWWNQYGSAPIETCIQRVKQLGAQGGGGVITKAGYWTEFEMFKAAGVRVGGATRLRVPTHVPGRGLVRVPGCARRAPLPAVSTGAAALRRRHD